jgi:hypothetical protein
MLEQILQRHAAFWRRAPADKPLVAALPQRVWSPKPYPLRGSRLAFDSQPVTVNDLDIDLLLGSGLPEPLLEGDLVNSLNCAYPAAWLEAVAGCPVHVSAYGCVARPVTADIDEALARFSVDRALRSPWLAFMDELLERAQARAGETCAVSQLHLRGVIDVLAAYLGEEALCLAAYDAPAKLAELADRMADLWIAVAERGFSRRRAWRGGYASNWWLYAPGRIADYQIDASSLFAPELYAARFARFDEKALRAFPYGLIHLHSVGLHHAATVAALAGARTVEINFDREAGHWDPAGMLAACRLLQARGKSLLLVGELSDEEFAFFAGALEPAGLAFYYWKRSVAAS